MQRTGTRTLALTVWDADTGCPVHSHAVNAELFKGLAWGKGGGFAVTRRGEVGEKGKPARSLADDFRVWGFTDPKAAPPLTPPFTGRATHDRPPRGAPVDSVEQPNGPVVGGGGFPTSTYLATNFWVDVVFDEAP